MKEKLLCGLLSALLLTTAATAAPIRVDGEETEISSAYRDGVTYVPLRDLMERFAGYETRWDGRARAAVSRSEEHTIVAGMKDRSLTVDGVRYAMPDAVFLREGSSYVPLRLLATACNAAVSLREGEIEIATKTRDRYPPQELYWLSRIISAESRGEPLRGQVAVGNVILNRVASPAFPNSVQGVVFDKRNAVQFEPVSNGSIYAAPSPQSVTAAKMALDGSREAGDALYFFAPSLSKGTWIAKNRAYLKTIGCHRFYL